VIDQARQRRLGTHSLVDENYHLEDALTLHERPTWSPTFTGVDAFAAARFTRTWPPRQAAVAAERVLYNRTAHSQTSTRVVLMFVIVPPRIDRCSQVVATADLAARWIPRGVRRGTVAHGYRR
jgi:hypothetical protein